MTQTGRILPAEGVFAHFRQPDDFAASLLGGQFEYSSIPGHGFSATLRLLRVADMVVQQSDCSTHTARGAIAPGMAALILPQCYAAAPARMDGEEVVASQAFFAPAGAEFYGHAPSAARWAALSLPLSQFEALAELAPLPMRPGMRSGRLALPDGPAARLTAALGQTAAMAEDLPSELALPGSAAGLAMSLREAVADVLTADARLLPRPRAGQEAHRVVSQVESYLRAEEGMPIYREQLCTGLGISLRKLHDAVAALTGLSPQVYLKTRRLTLARRALQRPGDQPPLIKSVALAHGFWHLGYFARDYRALFGETPSRTIAQAWPRRDTVAPR